MNRWIDFKNSPLIQKQLTKPKISHNWCTAHAISSTSNLAVHIWEVLRLSTPVSYWNLKEKEFLYTCFGLFFLLISLKSQNKSEIKSGYRSIGIIVDEETPLRQMSMVGREHSLYYMVTIVCQSPLDGSSLFIWLLMMHPHYKGYPHLLGSLVKNGCPKASLALNRSAGSYRKSPCKRSIRSPAEWSTCCIIRFCQKINKTFQLQKEEEKISQKGNERQTMNTKGGRV